MIAAVLAFGPLRGGALIYAALLLSACLAYALGRALGPWLLERLLGHAARAALNRFVDDYGAGAVVAARLSPAISTDAVSFTAGAVRLGFVRFILATALGTLPLTVLIAWLGADIDRLEGGVLWGSALTLLGFAAYVLWDRRRRRLTRHADC